MLNSEDLKKKALEIFNYAKFNGFTDIIARYVVAQAAHETNGFTSYIFENNNNAFGMKYAGQSSAKGVQYGYANYVNVAASVKDLAIWFGKRFIIYGKPILTIQNYVAFLKQYRYFEDTIFNYLKGCRHWYNKIYS